MDHLDSRPIPAPLDLHHNCGIGPTSVLLFLFSSHQHPSHPCPSLAAISSRLGPPGRSLQTSSPDLRHISLFLIFELFGSFGCCLGPISTMVNLQTLGHGDVSLQISLHVGPNVLLQVRLQSRKEGLESLLISHFRKPILQLLELLDVACELAGLPQCSQLLLCFFDLYDRLEPLHHRIPELRPHAKDWLAALRYVLKDRIHPGARCTLYPHGHHIKPISRGVAYQSHIPLHLG